MRALRSLLATLDGWQRRSPPAAVTYGVLKKFGDDGLNRYVVGLGWYGFLAIYPLLLVVVTIFGFIGVSSLGSGIVSTLHQFPVIGSQFNPGHGSSELHGSVFGLIIGLAGLIYGAQGVTQTAQAAMAQAWNVPKVNLPGFLPRLGRSLVALLIIGVTFLINAGAASYAAGGGRNFAVRVLVVLGMLVLNVLCFMGTFRALTPREATTRSLLPGAALGALGFTVLITLGSSLVDHQLRHTSATYGQFGAVIGLVGFLLFLAKISLYGAELNPVLHRHLWPRALVNDNPSDADERVFRDLAQQTQRRDDQSIRVRFGERDNAESTPADRSAE